MRSFRFAAFAALQSLLLHSTSAQQYAGTYINNSLPSVPGTEIAYWKITDPSGNSNLTLINYINHGSDGNRLVPANLQRAVIMIHGLDRDPETYEANALSALALVSDPNINTDSVAVVAPYFPNGDDKGYGYPWINGLAPNQGSITNCLVWKGSQWSAGGNNQYPYKSTNVSSYTVIDQMVKYFDNVAMFPNMKQIVVAGHSLGAQTVQRYAAIGQQFQTNSALTYWVANPNSYVWFSTSRPLDTSSCSIYDVYREGYTNFTLYPMTYGTSLVNSGRANILASFNAKAINYARGLQDLGDDSTTCAPYTTGADRNERFFNFIAAFPPSCANPSGRNCDTVDLINAGHDAGAMMASAAGQTRLYIDNFYGNGSRAYDFGYPREQAGDDPFPNPALNGTAAAVNNNTYAGNMTYWGCWTDQTAHTLPNMTYDNSANTIELCTATCAQNGFTIAGMEYGSQCFCGNALGYQAAEVIDSSCSIPCTGNANETCGGYSRLSLFASGRPTANAAPGTPEVVGNFYYANCYTDSQIQRSLTSDATAGSFMTLEYCANYCGAYKYFGTEYAQECYCGNSLTSGANVTLSGDCSMPCAGDATELCGAANRLTVYMNPNWSSSGSSSVAVVASTTSAAAGTATSVSCPASNNTIVISNGRNFLVECGIDHQGGDLTSTTVSGFQGCIDACAQNSACVDVSLSGTACYLKTTLGVAQINSGVQGAKLIASNSTPTVSSSSSSTISTGSSIVTATATTLVTSTTTPIVSSATVSPSPVSCPSSNNTLITSYGQTFMIECGIDHQGGDLTYTYVNTFQQCIDACSQNAQCVDVSLSGAACYLKSTLGVAQSNGGVSGARLVTNSTGVSTTSSTSASGSTTSASTVTTNLSTSSSISTSASATATSSPVSCPSANGTTYVSNGLAFLIECGIDHAGGDMSSATVSPQADTGFAQCISLCASTNGCVDISLSGVGCYMKSTLGPASSNSGVFGAKLIGPATTSTISATAFSTSSSTTLSSQTASLVTSSVSAGVSSASTFSTSTLTSSSTSSSTSGALPPGFTAIGCYFDSSSSRAFPYENGSTSTNTPSQCALNCRASGYTYSGTEYGSECWCGYAIPSTGVAPASDCSQPCSGDSTQACGAGNRISVVSDSTPTFSVRQRYNTWSLMSCYIDQTASRTLANRVDLSSTGGAANATIAHCLDACNAQGYSYCGAEYYSECYGATSLPSSATVASGANTLAAGCSYACTGNSTESCGGAGRILIYTNNGTATTNGN